MIIKTKEERENLIEGGKRLARVLAALRVAAVPGATTKELNDLAEKMIRDGGDVPSFLGYTPGSAKRPYPAALCLSINDAVVHGIPNEDVKILKEGDIVGLDLGLTHKGIIVDAAITAMVGKIDKVSKKLLTATERALEAGIAQAIPGNCVGDISSAIQKEVEGAGFTIAKEFGGHGVGNKVHEQPFIPNFGRAGRGIKLVEGMVLALEPITIVGKAALILCPDGYTYRTKDGSRSAHFEHTILLEKDGARIITLL